MWIELIGLPGIGKTTLVEKNISTIQRGYEIIKSDRPSICQKIITKFLFFFCYAPKLKDKNLAAKLAYRHGFKFGQNKSKNIFFYDSGMVQVLLENLIETNFADTEEKLGILPKFPNHHKIIYLKDDIKEIADREIKRPQSRFGLEIEETLKRYQQAQNIIEKQLLQTSAITDTISPHDTDEFIKAIQSEKTS